MPQVGGGPQSLQWGEVPALRGGGEVSTHKTGGQEEGSLPEAGWPGPLAPNFMSCPSQAEGERTPLDAFQLPASAAREDASSPEPEPTGDLSFQPSPWEALSGLWAPCGVWRLFTVKVQFKFQEFPGCPRVRTLGSHCHELGLIPAWWTKTPQAMWCGTK